MFSLPSDRRSEVRLRPTTAIRVTLGRGNGTILDISRGGARIRHTGTLRRGAEVRVSFRWQDAHFDATAEVLATRVESLGDAEQQSTVYETRVRFVRISERSSEVLARVLAATSNGELRRWVANLRGWSEPEPGAQPHDPRHLFVRCTFLGAAWRKVMTHTHVQPADGFVLPATVSAHEIRALCDTYARADADGRHLIRLTASAVIEEAVAEPPVAA